MSGDGHREAIVHEQIAAVYAQLPVTLLVSVLNALLVTFVLRPVVDPSVLNGWCALIVLAAIIRTPLWRAYRKASPQSRLQRQRLWGTAATLGSLVAGAFWGGGSAILFPPQEAYQMFLALVIGGMCAGAATVNAAHFPTVVAFILPATLPLAARFAMEGGRLQLALAALCVVFGVALCVVSITFQRMFVMGFRAQLAVNEANRRLVIEMATRKSAEDKLLQAQKLEALGRLTAGIAHDFNNLLMTIGLVAENAARGAAPGSNHSASLALIAQTVDRGRALTQRLLAFGRTQALRPGRVDLNQLIENLRPTLLTTLGERASLTVIPSPDLPAVLVDPEQIENAILNLVINARDALPEHGPARGHIRISTKSTTAGESQNQGVDLSTANYVIVSVSDDGTGMQDAVRRKAFEPFFTTKETGRGSGLGLSQVYGLARQSGGTATIESEPGYGTTVRLFLPIAPSGT
jgi:signal transduction histidine kinase